MALLIVDLAPVGAERGSRHLRLVPIGFDQGSQLLAASILIGFARGIADDRQGLIHDRFHQDHWIAWSLIGR